MSETDVPEEPVGDPVAAADHSVAGSYRVLARKYRPTTFAELIGQEAMVRTLTNALRSGRLAHAFLLTGVRGVGKTTTARIIARALNCSGEGSGPTTEPCGTCDQCLAIAEDRHVDVLEMDAASRTGVDDIRELIEGVRYRPTSARFKVYIIDEVHMLSRNAFNALLKTLEEPPEHVKFVFATTEVRKLPVTVLSRCQRFDLRRVDGEVLSAHLAEVARREGFAVDGAALHLITRAADGSVRDGLSLLDQALVHCADEVGEDAVRDMLGLADRGQTFMMLEAALAGRVPVALDLLAQVYGAGADPALVLEDMLELTHWLTRIKVTPDVAEAPGVPELERVRGTDMAGRLSMAALARAWQMLLKGLDEVRRAPSPIQAAEMILVRLAYAAELPTPAEAVAAPDGAGAAPKVGPPGAPPPQPNTAAPSGRPTAAVSAPAVVATAPDAPPDPAQSDAEPRSFAEVVDLVDQANERVLHANLSTNFHLVHFEPGRIEFRPGPHAPGDLANRLSRFLNATTQRRWVVTVSGEEGAKTLVEQAEATRAEARDAATEHPLVKAVMETFPGAAISDVRAMLPDPVPSDGEAPSPEGEAEQ